MPKRFGLIGAPILSDGPDIAGVDLRWTSEKGLEKGSILSGPSRRQPMSPIGVST